MEGGEWGGEGREEVFGVSVFCIVVDVVCVVVLGGGMVDAAIECHLGLHPVFAEYLHCHLIFCLCLAWFFSINNY